MTNSQAENAQDGQDAHADHGIAGHAAHATQGGHQTQVGQEIQAGQETQAGQEGHAGVGDQAGAGGHAGLTGLAADAAQGGYADPGAPGGAAARAEGQGSNPAQGLHHVQGDYRDQGPHSAQGDYRAEGSYPAHGDYRDQGFYPVQGGYAEAGYEGVGHTVQAGESGYSVQGGQGSRMGHEGPMEQGGSVGHGAFMGQGTPAGQAAPVGQGAPVGQEVPVGQGDPESQGVPEGMEAAEGTGATGNQGGSDVPAQDSHASAQGQDSSFDAGGGAGADAGAGPAPEDAGAGGASTGRLAQAVEAAEQALIEFEIAVETFRVEVENFSRLHHQRLGPMYARLDELDVQIAEAIAARTGDPEDVRKAREARASVLPMPDVEELFHGWMGSEGLYPEAEAMLNEQPVRPPQKVRPSEEARRVYRDLVRKAHPDLARDEAERDRRDAFIMRVNAAYGAGDEAALRELAREWEAGPAPREQRTGESEELYARLEWLAERKEMLAVIAAELEDSAIGAMIKMAPEDPDALLEEIAEKLLADVAEREAYLAQLVG